MTKIKLLMGYGLLWGSAVSAYAQDKMYINLKNQTLTAHALSELKNISFPQGQVVVSKKDGSRNVQVLKEVKNILFEIGGPVTHWDEMLNDAGRISLYPNPLKGDQLKIMLGSQSTQSFSITFLSPNGNMEKQFSMAASQNFMETILDLSDLDAGMHICHINIDNQIYTHKIIKY